MLGETGLFMLYQEGWVQWGFGTPYGATEKAYCFVSSDSSYKALQYYFVVTPLDAVQKILMVLSYVRIST